MVTLTHMTQMIALSPPSMGLDTRVVKNPWGSQMPNCTITATHVFSEKTACTADHAARNNRCTRPLLEPFCLMTMAQHNENASGIAGLH